MSRQSFCSCVAASIFFATATNAIAAQTCDVAYVDLRAAGGAEEVAAGQAHFNVEIADDPEEQAKGLMFREHLPTSSGMLFVYDSPRTATFWMRNTLIPLDIIFIDAQGRVVHIAQNAKPHDESLIYGGDNIQLILEINGGMARGLGIFVGSHLRHPSIKAENAAWPCPSGQ